MFISCGFGGPTFLISITGTVATLELPQSQIKFEMYIEPGITLEEFMLDAMDLSMDTLMDKWQSVGALKVVT